MKIKKISRSEYHRLCPKFEEATFFHSTTWHEILETTYNIKIVYLAFIDNETVAGILPVMKRNMFGLSIYGTPLPKANTPDIFPLFTGNIKPEVVLKSIHNWAKNNKWKHLQIAWPYNNIKGSSGTREEVHSVVKVELNRPLEAIWRSIKREARNRIRAALQQNIKIHIHPTNRYFDEYKKLQFYTYNVSQGINPIVSPHLLDKIWKTKNTLPVKIFTATHNGNVVAMLWIFFSKHACHYWEGASDDTGRKLSANHLLHWEAIQWARSSNIRYYDMVGGGACRGDRDNSKGKGILQFKRSLGAHVSKNKIIYWQPKWVYILFLMYRVYLRLKVIPVHLKKSVL